MPSGRRLRLLLPPRTSRWGSPPAPEVASVAEQAVHLGAEDSWAADLAQVPIPSSRVPRPVSSLLVLRRLRV